MEIKASSIYDKKTIKKFSFESISKKGSAKKKIIPFLCVYAVLFLALIAEIIFFGADTVLILLFALCTICLVIEILLFFVFPSTRYNALCSLKDVKNEFVFSDDRFTVSSKSDKYDGRAEIEYSSIVRVIETDDYFYIFQSLDQAFIAEKSTFTGGSPEELREKLMRYCTKYDIRHC